MFFRYQSKLECGESCLETFADCPICGGGTRQQLHGYFVCQCCGHRWKTVVMQVEMENEALLASSVLRADRLTNAKLRAVRRLARSRGTLLDFGAGSGKFVFFSKRLFTTAEGVEVTPACRSFARDVLGVALWPKIPRAVVFDVVTAWHVLEHLPPYSLSDAGQQLHDSTRETLVVSVPNAESWASQWFGGRYPYRDVVSHYHEFSPESMRRFLRVCGWRTVVPFRVWIYSVFCYAQGITNVATQTHNLLYFRLKRGSDDGSLSASGFVVHCLIFLASVPVALAIAAVELLAPEKGCCIHLACYKPRAE